MFAQGKQHQNWLKACLFRQLAHNAVNATNELYSNLRNSFHHAKDRDANAVTAVHVKIYQNATVQYPYTGKKKPFHDNKMSQQAKNPVQTIYRHDLLFSQ